jgi:hypothetical protein
MLVLGQLVERPRVLLALRERGLRLQRHPVRLVTLALGRLQRQPPRQASALIALLALGHQWRQLQLSLFVKAVRLVVGPQQLRPLLLLLA